MKDAGVPLQPAGASALVQFREKNSNRTNRNHHFHFLLIFQGTNNSVTRQSAAAETWAWIWMMNAVFTSRTGSGSARSGSVQLGPAPSVSVRTFCHRGSFLSSAAESASRSNTTGRIPLQLLKVTSHLLRSETDPLQLLWHRLDIHGPQSMNLSVFGVSLKRHQQD